MASCCSSRCQSGKLPDFASYARANAEYFYYCSQWWWEMFLRSRGESDTCECAELHVQYQSAHGRPPSSLCECNFREAIKEHRGIDSLYGGSSCCDGNGGSIPEVYNYERHRFDNYGGWTQSSEVPGQFRSDMRGDCHDSTEYAKDDDQKCQYDSEDDETIEMEVNEDFRKFLEQSKRYREDREKLKKIAEESSEEEYVEVGSVPVVATSRPPSEQQGFERKKAMKDLYGQQSEHIMSLETSLQLNYDRNSDIRRPIFWPNIPLKF